MAASYTALPRTTGVLTPAEAERLRLLSFDHAAKPSSRRRALGFAPLSFAAPRSAVACVRIVVAVLLVAVVVVVLVAALLPLRLLVEKYISETFHVVPHAPAVVNLQAGTIELHFSSSFKVTNGMKMALNGVALEIDYLHIKDDKIYSLARAMSPELLQMGSNKTLAVLLDRDFYLLSATDKVPATASSQAVGAGSKKEPESAPEPEAEAQAQRQGQEHEGTPNSRKGNRGLAKRSEEDEEYDLLREIAEDATLGETPDLEDDEDEAMIAHRRKGDLDGADSVTHAGRSRGSAGAGARGQKPNQKRHGHGHSHGRKPQRHWQRVHDRNIEAFMLAAHDECLSSGNIKFIIGVKFYYHFFLNIWSVFRTAAFEYQMKCVVINTNYPVFGDYSPMGNTQNEEM